MSLDSAIENFGIDESKLPIFEFFTSDPELAQDYAQASDKGFINYEMLKAVALQSLTGIDSSKVGNQHEMYDKTTREKLRNFFRRPLSEALFADSVYTSFSEILGQQLDFSDNVVVFVNSRLDAKNCARYIRHNCFEGIVPIETRLVTTLPEPTYLK